MRKIKSKIQAIIGIIKGDISYERNTVNIDDILKKASDLNIKYKEESFTQVKVEVGSNIVKEKYAIYTPFTSHIYGNDLEKLFSELERKLSGKEKESDEDKIIIEI